MYILHVYILDRINKYYKMTQILIKQTNSIMPKLNFHNCNRCEYEWLSKLENPQTCANPKCRTPYWNKSRIRKQIKKKPSNEKFYFYFEIKNTRKSYSFKIIDDEITCTKCANKTCNHVFEIMFEPKIQEKIAEQGIGFSPKYENEIKELGKNILALAEFVEKPT